MSETTAKPYVAGPVERFGRRLKMEYVGMASVHAVVFFLIFAPLPSRAQAGYATLGILGLFLGLKKKTRDHLSASLLLFTAASVAAAPLAITGWAVPYLLFGATVCAMEGYVEKLQEQIYALPLLFAIWAWLDPVTWAPALLLFVALYLSHPWSERPGLRRRFSLVFVATVVVAVAAALLRPGSAQAALAAWQRVPLRTLDLVVYAAVALPTVLALAVYWRRLLAPHRANGVLFTLLAPLDVRLLAMYGMVATVVLSATVLHLSVDSDRLRPYFKHAEWHFFWWVFALALWGGIAHPL